VVTTIKDKYNDGVDVAAAIFETVPANVTVVVVYLDVAVVFALIIDSASHKSISFSKLHTLNKKPAPFPFPLPVPVPFPSPRFPFQTISIPFSFPIQPQLPFKLNILSACCI